jgi:beta-N-acetylhexosaminidase
MEIWPSARFLRVAAALISAAILAGCGGAAAGGPASLPAAGTAAPSAESASAGSPSSTPASSTPAESIPPPSAADGSSAASPRTSAGRSRSITRTVAATGTSPAPPPTSTGKPRSPSSATRPSTGRAVPLAVTAADRRRAADLVARMTVAQRAGAVIMPVAAQVTGKIAAGHYGGVILMGSNGVVDGTGSGGPQQVRAQVTALQQQRDSSVPAPLLIGVDQEYGQVARLVHGFTRFPGASELAGIRDTAVATALTERMATAAAAEMRAVGISVDFAPDSDVLPVSGDSAIGDRSYGTDPRRVAAFVAAAVRGYQAGGVAATIKHFPGIGRIAVDTHTALPTLTAGCAEWSRTEAVPMAAGVQAGAALVMTGHVHFPAVSGDAAPASLSSKVVTELLRGKGYAGCAGLVYRGVTVTDSLQMSPVADSYASGEAAWRALAAGQDLVLMPIDPVAAAGGIVAAVQNGSLSTVRLADAATAVVALRLATARSQRPSISVVNCAAHRALAAQANSAG